MLKAQLQEKLDIRAGQSLLITSSVFHLKVYQNFPILENDYCLPDSETVDSSQANFVSWKFVRENNCIIQQLQRKPRMDLSISLRSSSHSGESTLHLEQRGEEGEEEE